MFSNEVSNPARAQSLYDTAQRMLNDDAVAVPLTQQNLVLALNKNWGGYVLDPGKGKNTMPVYTLEWIAS